jgi:hypothetical protein
VTFDEMAADADDAGHATAAYISVAAPAFANVT